MHTFSTAAAVIGVGVGIGQFENPAGEIELGQGMSSTLPMPSALVLTPSTPSITHFVNDSFIIFCKTVQRISTPSGVIPGVKPVRTPKDVSTSRRRRVSEEADRQTDWQTALINAISYAKIAGSLCPSPAIFTVSFSLSSFPSQRLFLGLLALVFEHISLDDKGNWTCEMDSAAAREATKSFELLVNRKSNYLANSNYARKVTKDSLQSRRQTTQNVEECLVRLSES